MMTRNTRNRIIKGTLAIGLFGVAFEGDGCAATDIVKRFREAYTPGFTDGLSAAITDPNNAEVGLREAGAAVVQGIGAIIQPRTPSLNGGGSSSSSSGSSSSGV